MMSGKSLILLLRVGLCLVLSCSLMAATSPRTVEILVSDIHGESAGGACLAVADAAKKQLLSHRRSALGRAVRESLHFALYRLRCLTHFPIASGHVLHGHRLYNSLLAPALL